MKDISGIAKNIQASATLQVDAVYKEMKAKGMDVVGFGAGEPDFGTPENIKEAAYKAIRGGHTKYTASGGIFALRKAISERLLIDCGVQYESDQIVVASGAKHCIYIALQTLINPGDEVILPAPYWVSYIEAIKMARGIPVIIPTSETNDFKITREQFESMITDKTKLFILCNPSNPTGMLYSKNELQDIAEICVKHDLYIISDEIYSKLIYDRKIFTSFAALGDDVYKRCIIVSGVSKTYAMTGWRIGYTASSVQLAQVMENYLSHSTSAPSTISQYAAVEALNGSQESVMQMRDTFEKRRDYIVRRINSISGVSCRKPDGAFYIMLCIERLIGKTLGGRLIRNSDDFALALLEDSLVATVSCTGFGIDNYVRLTYAASMETIEKGMDRIEKFIAKI